MSTHSSNRQRLAIGCLTVVLGTYLSLTLTLQSVAAWAEREAGAHPYWDAENPLRYLTPSLHENLGRPRLLLMGASKAEEALLYEEFVAAFPETQVLQGAFSNATLDDIIVALNYIERTYGEDAIPRTVVLGIDYRLIANLPRRFGDAADKEGYAFFLDAIRAYSSEFTPEATESGTVLKAKSPLSGHLAGARFYVCKQQPRYRAALVKALDVILNGKDATDLDLPPLPEPGRESSDGWHRHPLHVRALMTWSSYCRSNGIFDALRRWSREFAKPYNIRYRTRADVATIAANTEWPAQYYRWNPRAEEALLRMQLAALREFVNTRKIELHLVNLPEHSLYRSHKRLDYYEAYVGIVRECLPDAGWIDLESEVADVEFQDGAHVALAGAKQVTHRVIESIHSFREKAQ